MPNLSGPMSLGVSSAAVRPVRGTVFTVSCCRPKNALTWRSEVQSSGEGDASKASGLRSPVILVAKRNLTMQSEMLSGARAARRCPHRGSVTGARAFGLHCPHPPGYAFRAPFQGRSIHWVTWAGTPLFWPLFFGSHP